MDPKATRPLDDDELDLAYEELRAELRRRVERCDAGEGEFLGPEAVLRMIEELRQARRSQQS